MLDTLAAVIKGLGYAAALTGAGTVITRSTLVRGRNSPLSGPNFLVRLAGSLLAVTSSMTALIFFLRLGGDADAAVPRQHQWHRFEVVI